MQRQSSTAISDLVLALSALWGFRAVAQAEGGTGGDVDHRFAKWWFMLVTLAASLGVIRFGARESALFISQVNDSSGQYYR